MITCAPCTIACAILPAAILPWGTSTSGLRPARAAYAAIDAEVLPVDAHTTASAPSAAATEIAVVMPRSLKEPVGLSPSTLSQTSAPVSPDSQADWHQRRAALAQGHGRDVLGDVEQVAVLLDHAAPLVGGAVLGMSHSDSPPSTRITEVTSRTMSIPRSAATVAESWASVAWWRDHDELGVGAAPLLADGLDRDAVVGEGGGHRGEHAGAVVDVDRDVVAGQRLAHRAAPRRSAYADSPAPRVPASRLRATVTRSPRTALARRRAAGPGAVEHQLAGRLGLDEDRVVGLAHRRQRVRPRDHRRVHADGDRGLAFPSRSCRASSQMASSLTTLSISRAEATSAAVTSEMPSR